MKKVLSVLTVALLSAAVLFAGGSSESGDGQIHITMMDSYAAEDPHGQYVYEYAEKFMEANPNVTIEIQAVASNDIYTRLAAMATSPDELPTMFFTSADQIPTLYDLGLTEDLNNYMTDEDKALWTDGIIESGIIDGNLTYVPVSLQPTDIIYRIDRFEEAGLEIPTTWDEFVECARALTKDTDGDGQIDQWGFGMVGSNDSSGQSRFMSYLWSNGYECAYLEDGEWKTEVGSPESIQAFQFFSDLKNKYGVVPPGAIENSFNENVNLMAMEQIGMLIAGSNSVGKIFNANPDLRGKIGSVQMPSGVTTFTPVSMLGWSLNPESKNKELAMEFVKFMSNKENSIRWVEVTGRLPAMKDAIADSDYLADPLFDGFIAGVENMEQAPNAPFYAEVKTELGRTYQKLLLDPSLDVAAEVKACGEAIQNIIDNNA